MTQRTEPLSGGGPSIGALFGALARGTGTLVRQEVELASTEFAGKTSAAAKALGVVLTGGAIIHAGVLTLMAALVLGLAAEIPIWMSAAVLGVIAAGVGYGLLKKGLRSLATIDYAPQNAVRSIEDDRRWAKEQLR